MGPDMQHVKSEILITAIFVAVAIWAATSQATILVEAESFEDLGGNIIRSLRWFMCKRRPSTHRYPNPFRILHFQVQAFTL